jgi:hypothetical protein
MFHEIGQEDQRVMKQNQYLREWGFDIQDRVGDLNYQQHNISSSWIKLVSFLCENPISSINFFL